MSAVACHCSRLQRAETFGKEKFSILPRLANIFDATVSKPAAQVRSLIAIPLTQSFSVLVPTVRRVKVTRFIDYAPMVFQRDAYVAGLPCNRLGLPKSAYLKTLSVRRIRASFGIHSDDYLRSVGPEQLLGNMALGLSSHWDGLEVTQPSPSHLHKVLGNLSSLSELSSEGKSHHLTVSSAATRFPKLCLSSAAKLRRWRLFLLHIGRAPWLPQFRLLSKGGQSISIVRRHHGKERFCFRELQWVSSTQPRKYMMKTVTHKAAFCKSRRRPKPLTFMKLPGADVAQENAEEVLCGSAPKYKANLCTETDST